MNRFPFLLRTTDADACRDVLLKFADTFRNFSAWKISSYIFAYFEGGETDEVRMLEVLKNLPENVERVCLPGQMDVMYENLGCVREEKDGITHRVFAAKLKPGCAEEYKRRHATIPPMAKDVKTYESNWGIWLGDGHIFGYCERDASLRREPTEEQREANIAWETKQLEIMDWLTDDVDWLTKEHHSAVQRIL